MCIPLFFPYLFLYHGKQLEYKDADLHIKVEKIVTSKEDADAEGVKNPPKVW
jgi:hypothetical protein